MKPPSMDPGRHNPALRNREIVIDRSRAEAFLEEYGPDHDGPCGVAACGNPSNFKAFARWSLGLRKGSLAGTGRSWPARPGIRLQLVRFSGSMWAAACPNNMSHAVILNISGLYTLVRPGGARPRVQISDLQPGCESGWLAPMRGWLSCWGPSWRSVWVFRWIDGG